MSDPDTHIQPCSCEYHGHGSAYTWWDFWTGLVADIDDAFYAAWPKWFRAWMQRRWDAQNAVEADRMAAQCILSADAQPYAEHFWLSEAKRYAERAQGYRRG